MKLFREERLAAFIVISLVIICLLIYGYIRFPQIYSLNSSRDSALFVKVTGAVYHPGDYGVRKGATAGEAAVTAGVRTDADMDLFDRDRPLSERDLVYVPHLRESLAEAERWRETALKKLRRPIQLKPININCATVEELMTLPGIGSRLAESIVAERSKTLFRTAAEIKRVAGIGEKKYKGVKDYITVSANGN